MKMEQAISGTSAATYKVMEGTSLLCSLFRQIRSTLNMLVVKAAVLSKKVMVKVKTARSLIIDMEVDTPGFALDVLKDSRFNLPSFVQLSY